MQRFLIFIMLCAGINVAHAFESWEHKRLADLSYYLAVEIFCEVEGRELIECTKQPDKHAPPLRMMFYDEVHLGAPKKSKNMPSEGISYGDIVTCVDYFLTSEKLIAGREHHLIQNRMSGKKAAGEDQKFTHSGELFPVNVHDLHFNDTKRCDPGLWNLEGARAGHVNHNHFQAELLVAQRMNHLSALTMATSEKKIFSALTFNAISDHYLHDSFAPGHITTWRSRLTDTSANAFHDYNNQKGWDVEVDMTLLQGYTNPLCGAKIQLLSAIFEKLNGNDSNTNKVRAYFFSPGESNNKDCGDECFSEAGNYGERFEKLKTFYKQSGNVKINVKGDNRLWRLSQDRQRLLMLWTEVRSIYDVLQSWHGTEIMKKNDKLKHGNAIYFVDSFSKNSSWKWDFTKVDDGSIIFGTDSSKIEAAFGPVKYTVPFQDRHENRGDIDRKWVSYKSLDRLWGVSYGVDNMTFGDSQNRKLLTFETIFARKSSKEWYSENWALTGGIQAYSGFGPDGLALTTRLLYVLPATETALSVQLRGLRLSRRDAPALWKPTIGGRVDFGFTSFMTSYLQFGRDFALQKDNGVRSGWSIGAGIQLVAPTCRIPLIKNLGSCD